MVATPEEVLTYWFEGGPDRTARWFGAGPATDAEVRRRFGDTLERAARGELDEWAATPRGRLALVVVLDQFSRNVHRGTARSFAQDSRALALCLEGLGRGEDRALAPVERAFFYMPLQHAEDAGVQERSVACFERLAAEAPDVAGFLDYARQHRDAIARFGRFPHRNATLSRRSTPEEDAFLAAERS